MHSQMTRPRAHTGGAKGSYSFLRLPCSCSLQPFEAQAFATYMAGNALFVDVWDADALMHVGTLALPLRALLRQQKGVVKTAMVSNEQTKHAENESKISLEDEHHKCFTSLLASRMRE